MGGEVKKLEPEKCNYQKKKKEVWPHLKKGKVTNYIEKLHGYKPHVIENFYKAWDSDKAILYGRKFILNVDFIVEVTRLTNEGMIFFKKKKYLEEVIKHFPKNDQEEVRLVNVGNFYDLSQIKDIWQEVLTCVQLYFILDGRISRVHQYHFVF